jgi:hypothetical protein
VAQTPDRGGMRASLTNVRMVTANGAASGSVAALITE